MGVGVEGMDEALRIRLARARECGRFSGFGVPDEESEDSMSISGVSWVLSMRACMSTVSLGWGRGGSSNMLDTELAVCFDSM